MLSIIIKTCTAILIIELTILATLLAMEYVKKLLTKPKDTYEEVVFNEEYEDDKLIRQAQQYDIEDFRDRMKRMRNMTDVDENGLFDFPIIKTKEEMGFTTGVEVPPEV